MLEIVIMYLCIIFVRALSISIQLVNKNICFLMKNIPKYLIFDFLHSRLGAIALNIFSTMHHVRSLSLWQYFKVNTPCKKKITVGGSRSHSGSRNHRTLYHYLEILTLHTPNFLSYFLFFSIFNSNFWTVYFTDKYLYSTLSNPCLSIRVLPSNSLVNI